MNYLDFFQLNFIYLLALLDLIFNSLQYIIIHDYLIKLPKMLSFTFLKMFQYKIFMVWHKPQNIYYFSLLIIDLFIIKSIFNFSEIVKYNLLLIFILLMLQSLFLNYWDLLFNSQNLFNNINISNTEEFIIPNKILSLIYLFQIFIIFFSIYLFFYINALKQKFIKSKLINWLTNSVAFWLKINF
jgi:hypothetical protein